MSNSKTPFPAANAPRPPSEVELNELWQWMRSQQMDEVYMLREEEWFHQFWIAVFDHYITGSPGYAGKVLYLVWDGAPEFCTVFIWNKEGIVPLMAHADCGKYLCDEADV